MCCTVAELEHRLSFPEFIEWLAYKRMRADGKTPSAGSSWQDQMKTMRMLTTGIKQ